jgi:hypothetical protein
MDKSLQQNLRINYAISGYMALLSALVAGALFIWASFNTAYLAVAAVAGFMAFVIEWLQLRIQYQLGVIIFLLVMPAQIIARHLLLLNTGHEHFLHPVQFLSMAVTIWQLLLFIFRKHLLKKLDQAAGTTA